jgi:hypothetical protein
MRHRRAANQYHKEVTIDPGSLRCFRGWWCTGASRDIRPRKLHLHSRDRSSAETSHNGSPQTRSYANDLLSRRFVRSTIPTRLRRRGICLSVQSHNLRTDLRSPSFWITLQISQFIARSSFSRLYTTNLLVLILFIIGLAQECSHWGITDFVIFYSSSTMRFERRKN